MPSRPTLKTGPGEIKPPMGGGGNVMMDVIYIEGGVPGVVVAGIAERGRIKRVQLEVARHNDGGWKARSLGGQWGLRCNAVATAIILEATEIFAAEAEIAEMAEES